MATTSSAALALALALAAAAACVSASSLPLQPRFSGAGRVATRAAFATNTTVFDIRRYGAVGDGTTDDTLAVQAAADACSAVATGCVLYIPAGLWRVASAGINITGEAPMSLVGDGWQSNVLWATPSTLFTWTSSAPLAWLNVRDVAVSSVAGDKPPESFAFAFPAGFTKSTVGNVLLYGSGAIPGTQATASLVGSGFDMGAVTDTVTASNVVAWFIVGTGYRVGYGSETRILGGRVVGSNRAPSSVGVHVTGNNGGVHIASTDVISLHVGVLLDDSNGHGSNREVFINSATLDSNWRGLAVHDQSYVSIAGVWAASSVQDNIWVSPSSTDAMLAIAGGTIFNAGAIAGNCTTQCNGMVVNAGSFSLSGVAVRNNKGRGLWVPSPGVSGYSITGCRVYSNGQAVDLSGTGFMFSSNVVYDNTQPNAVHADSTSVVANNVGCC